MKYKLRNFVEAVSETEPSPQNSQFDRFVGLEHYDSGEIEITRYTDTSLLSSSVKIFRANDILIARRNVYLKRAGIVFFDGLTSGDSIILRVLKDCERGTGVPYSDALRWLPLILNSSAFWAYANKHADGMNSKRISKEMLLDYEFGAPSIETIRSIADKVWSAHSLKKRYRKLLDLTDDMVKSRFIEMFGDPFKNEKGWGYYSLSKVTTIVLGTTPSSSNPDYWDGDIKWITPAELNDDSFYVYDSERHITEAGVRSTALKPFPAGTVIFSTRAPIGKTAIAGCEMYCNQGFKNFICSDKLNPVYLFYTLKSHKEELQKMGTGSTFLELSKKTIEGLSISLPPRELQDEFEVIYKQADKSKFELKQAIEKIDKVMRALLQ